MRVAGEIWLIANPTAGAGRGRHSAALAADALGGAGILCRLVQPTSAQGTADAAGEAVRSGAATVLACGGDGTVHDVAQALVGTEAALGIVPCGSGDDIAAALGFPVGDPAAVSTYLISAIEAGSTRLVDVGHVTAGDGTTSYFLGVLSTGFDSAVNERANTMARLGGQRYNVAMVRELASFRPSHYELRLDDEVISGEAMLVAVGNGPTYGGGMRICPRATTDDGQLDVTWLSAMSKPTFLRAFPSVFTGHHVTHPAVRTFRGRNLTISASGQVAYADGERVGPLPVAIEARADALRVLTR